MFQQNHKVELWQPRRKFFNKKMESCCPRYELVSKIEQFSKKSFFASNWTFGHVEASFDRSNENFMAEGQKLFTQYPKKLKKLTNFSKSDVFSSKRSDGNIECSFENTLKKLTKGWKN